MIQRRASIRSIVLEYQRVFEIALGSPMIQASSVRFEDDRDMLSRQRGNAINVHWGLNNDFVGSARQVLLEQVIGCKHLRLAWWMLLPIMHRAVCRHFALICFADGRHFAKAIYMLV